MRDWFRVDRGAQAACCVSAGCVSVAGGAVVTLFAVGALFNALEHPEELRQRIEGAFRRPPKAPRKTSPDHYYQPHWKADS